MDIQNEIPTWVIMRGVVYPGQEKAPFVRSGMSIRGGIAYRPADDKVQCHECGDFFKSVSSHVRPAHGISAKEYKLKHGLRSRSGLVSKSVAGELAARPNLGIKAQGRPAQTDEVRRFRRERAIANVTLARKRGRMGHSYELRNERATCHAQLLDRLKGVIRIEGGLNNGLLVKYGMHPESVLRAFNLPNGKELVNALDTAFIDNSGKLSDEYLIESLRDFFVKRGTVPPYVCFGHGSLPAYATFVSRWGSMVAAYEVAGLGLVQARTRPNGRPFLISDQELLRPLCEFYAETGTLPTKKQLGRREHLIKRFGSMRAIYAAAGLLEAYDAIMPARANRSLVA